MCVHVTSLILRACHFTDTSVPSTFNVRLRKCRIAGVSDHVNKRLLEALNARGDMFLIHTELSGRFTIRLVSTDACLRLFSYMSFGRLGLHLLAARQKTRYCIQTCVLHF